jgi:hypothetical protein
MKDQLASLLRHAFTGWIAALVIFLTAKLSLTAEDVQAVQNALDQIGAGLLLLVITLAPIVGRLAWTWAANSLRTGSGESKNGQGSGGGLGLWVVMICTGAVMGGLPSCTPQQLAAARAVPIKGCITTDLGKICYSAKDGLTGEIDATSGK